MCASGLTLRPFNYDVNDYTRWVRKNFPSTPSLTPKLHALLSCKCTEEAGLIF